MTKSIDIARVLDLVEGVHGPVEFCADSPFDPHGTGFTVDGASATFSVITLEGTLPPDTYSVQVDGMPPGDYVYVATVSSSQLVDLIGRFKGPQELWPLLADSDPRP